MTDWVNDRGSRTVPARRDGAFRDGSDRFGWQVVIPVKGGPQAKSRLRAPDGVDRLLLARALALDTVAATCAALGSQAVVVVTPDSEVATGVRELGVGVHPDPGGGLNAAIRAGLAALSPSPLVAVLLADVPAVRPGELTAALTAALGHDCAFVPDLEGTGTVLLTSTKGALTPRFGTGSAVAHESAGHTRLELDLPGLRRDVDDEQSLRDALGLGVGAHTASLLAHLVAPASPQT